jgi:hypothetical protein
MIKEELKLVGRPVIRSYDQKHEPLIKSLFDHGLTAEDVARYVPEESVYIGENKVITTGLQLIFRLLNGISAGTTGVKYLAIGTATAAVTMADDWTVISETFRKAVTSFSYNTTTIFFDTFLASAEANFGWKEVILTGDTATTSSETGVIFSRSLLDKTKSATETVTVSWQDTIIVS